MKYAQRLRGRLHSVKNNSASARKDRILTPEDSRNRGRDAAFSSVSRSAESQSRFPAVCECESTARLAAGSGTRTRGGWVVWCGSAVRIDSRNGYEYALAVRLGGRGRSGAGGGRDVCRNVGIGIGISLGGGAGSGVRNRLRDSFARRCTRRLLGLARLR